MLSIERALQAAESLSTSGTRVVLGIAGCPGTGKSTLTDMVLRHLGPLTCAVVPMDGFHLDNRVLDAHGTRQRKGAPETFDAAGYAALLCRVANQRPGDDPLYAPVYDRAHSLSVAGALEISAEIPLIITEGNYLLLPTEPWLTARRQMSQCWFVDVADTIRVPRLIQRHIDNGKSPEAAHDWVHRSDEANSALVRPTATLADAIVAAT